MQCTNCGRENREHANFCGECGAIIGSRCGNCGASILPTNKFCDGCGDPVATSIRDDNVNGASASATPPLDSFSAAAKATASRRQMTLLCCDLIDSTKLTHQLDVEVWRYGLNKFHDISKQIISDYGGYYAQYMGDGFMAYFSYPSANEDDAHRAVLTGLKIIEEVQNVNVGLSKKYGYNLHLRVGVDTGPVIVDEHVVGEAPNIASRIQAIARRDTMAITETTRRLLPPNAFRYDDLGVHELKGLRAIRLFRVTGRVVTEENTISELAPADRLLVGRGEQLALLLEYWQRTKRGTGQSVIVAGEAGIGKTKLVQGLLARIQNDPHVRIKIQGSAFHQNTMLYPVIEHMQFAAKIDPLDSSATKLSKLRGLLQQIDASEIALPLISRLLSIPCNEDIPDTSERQFRQHVLDILCQFALRSGKQGPLLLVCEDMHWFDPTTMELINRIIPLVGSESALLIMTTRSNFTADLQQKYFLTQLTLNRLQSSEVEKVILGLTGGKPLPNILQERIERKANGVPLYVEELTKMVLEADFVREAEDQYELVAEPNFSIPLTLRDPLTSRVDRAKGQNVLRLASVLGRQFSFGLLSRYTALDEHVLAKALQDLVAAELLYQKGTPLREATFEFKHSLIRDAAYSLMTNADREFYHGNAGAALEEYLGDAIEEYFEVIAHHYSEARNFDKAVHYLYQAGRRSAARSAHNEAVRHFEQGLVQVAKIVDKEKRRQPEALLNLALGDSLRSTEGWGVDSVKNAYARALQLGERNGFGEHTFPAMLGLWTWNFVRTSFEEAHHYAQQLLSTADRMNDSVYQVLAYQAQGFTMFAKGRFTKAHDALRHSIALCDDSATNTYINLSAQDPRVHVRLYDGLTLWFLGYPDQALQICLDAQRYADKLEHPFSQAMASSITLRLYHLRDEAAPIIEQAQEAIAMCDSHDFKHYSAMARILYGWAVARQGRFDCGLAEIQAGLENELSTGSVLYESYALGLLADAYLRAGKYKQALDVLDEAMLKISEKDAERFYAAEILRLRGEALFRSGQDLGQAKRCFYQSLDIAQEQDARSLELKTYVSFHDLQKSSNDNENFLNELKDVYGSFKEGFETTDLIDAKSRLTRSPR